MATNKKKYGAFGQDYVKGPRHVPKPEVPSDPKPNAVVELKPEDPKKQG